MMRRFRLHFAVICFILLINALGTTVFAIDPVMTSRPFYQIEARYNPSKDEVTGQITVTIPEQRTEPLTEVYFHLYPNVFRDWKYEQEAKPEKPGYIKLSNVKVDGVSVNESIKETIMKVPLPKPLPIGKSAKIEMEYQLKLPRGGTRLNAFQNTAFLAQWYPMLAVKDQEGWHTEPYTTTGDPFYTQMSDFEVTFYFPEGYQVISTAKDQIGNLKSPLRLRADNVRDFVAVITKDYQVLKGKAGNIQVNLWYDKKMKDVAQPLLNTAIESMKFFGKTFGSYPYQEVDVVLGETGFGIAGMEYPGLITSIAKIPTEKGLEPAHNVVAHELAHQWWYGVVGNNQAKEPWLDEGLTTFSEFLFMEKKMKQNERKWLYQASDRTKEIHDAIGITSTQKLYDYPEPVYGLMVYVRPAAMMFRLMDEIGEEKVFKILQTYYNRYQYRIATSQDFFKVANEVAGKDLTPFFQEWLNFKSPQKANR